jgi:hypothetical protein
MISMHGSETYASLVRRLIFDYNPGPPGHWVNQSSEPVDNSYRTIQTREQYIRGLIRNAAPPPAGKYKRIISSWVDNPGYWDYAKWDYTDKGREYVTKTLQLYKGHLRQRWLYGLWAAASGTVYSEFDEQTHVIDPFTVPADWPWWVGFDPGKDHPCAVVWITRGPAGTLYIADELYGSGNEIRHVCGHIHANSKGRAIQRLYGDPQMVGSNTMHSEKTIQQQFRDFGLTLGLWPHTGRNAASMVEAVRTLLTEKPDPMLKVFRTCTNTINEFQTWRYKRTAAGALPTGDDQFEDRDNHALDCVRGLIAAGINRVGAVVRALTDDGEEQPGITVIEA